MVRHDIGVKEGKTLNRYVFIEYILDSSVLHLGRALGNMFLSAK